MFLKIRHTPKVQKTKIMITSKLVRLNNREHTYCKD